MKEDFCGQFDKVLDDKGRLSFPKEFRESCDSSDFVITNNVFKKSLCVYTVDEWESYKKFLLEKFPNPSDPIREATVRRVIGPAFVVSLDSNGRFLVPRGLRDSANLKREVILIGVLDKVEIWDKGELELVSSSDMENIERAFMASGDK